jgi:peptidylprolyl isomerase
MKLSILIVSLAACAITASAQAPAKPSSDAKPAATATPIVQPPAKPASDAKPPAADVKPLPHMTPINGEHKTLFTISLGYQDIKVGSGAEAMPKKLLKCNFTLWVAADGSEFDSTDEHRNPVLDNDKKPVLEADGKPKMSDPQPMPFVMGGGRPLLGWDLGVAGMKASGKRRIYIPWQLGFGDREMPARSANHAAVPAKSDLILDVELVDVSDAPAPPTRPNMMPGQHPMPGASPKLAPPATPAAPTPPSTPAAPPASAAPPATAQPQSK